MSHMHLGAHDPRSAQDRSTCHNLCSPAHGGSQLTFLDDLVNHSSQWDCEGEWVSDTSTLRYSSSLHPILSSPRLRSWESLECGARLWKWVDGLKFDAVGQLFKVFPVNRAPLCNLTQTTHHFQHHSLQLVFNENLAKWLFSNNQLDLRLVSSKGCSTRWLTCFCQKGSNEQCL